MRSDNLKRHMKLHMNRKLDDKPVKKRKFNKIDDVIDHEKMNSLFCPCNKCLHWEKYEECKICNAENICSNEEEMDKNDKDKPTYYSEQLPTHWELFKNNSEAGENKNNKEEQKLLNEIVLQMQKNKQDSNCSETLHYCAHCDYATKRKFNMKDHIERKHAREEEIICCNNEKSHIECIREGEKNDLFEDSIEVWKIYKMLRRMKNK